MIFGYALALAGSGEVLHLRLSTAPTPERPIETSDPRPLREIAFEIAGPRELARLALEVRGQLRWDPPTRRLAWRATAPLERRVLRIENQREGPRVVT